MPLACLIKLLIDVVRGLVLGSATNRFFDSLRSSVLVQVGLRADDIGSPRGTNVDPSFTVESDVFFSATGMGCCLLSGGRQVPRGMSLQALVEVVAICEGLPL